MESIYDESCKIEEGLSDPHRPLSDSWESNAVTDVSKHICSAIARSKIDESQLSG